VAGSRGRERRRRVANSKLRVKIAAADRYRTSRADLERFYQVHDGHSNRASVKDWG